MGRPQSALRRCRSGAGGEACDAARQVRSPADGLVDYAGKVSGMAARYVVLGSTLDNSAIVKKLLNTVADRLYAAVTGIEQFCNMEEMAFEQALGWLKAFEERTRQRV
ncbi:uncharacterized protein [Triticum aestivum]|uniref:uncharacterized protein n=1 Tax=Triticum aestivum TaxID=4565 RepID=UPI001D02F487|nr:uncharacterized protein LOC123130238 [Triticum aestivum]